jgi:hypothetical protein
MELLMYIARLWLRRAKAHHINSGNNVRGITSACSGLAVSGLLC